MEEKAIFLYALASAVTAKLWMKGLITDDEKEKIDLKNNYDFLQKQPRLYWIYIKNYANIVLPAKQAGQ